MPGQADDPNAIKRVDLDGTNETTIGFAYSSFGLESSEELGQIYWSDSGESSGNPDSIVRADSNGNGREEIVKTDLSLPFEISIDSRLGKIYWADTLTRQIERANLDGSVRELVYEVPLNSDGPLRAVHVDSRNGDVYFGLQRAGLFKIENGSTNPIEIVMNASPFGLDLDPLEDMIYWTNVESGKIQRSLLDGTQVEDIVTGGIGVLGGLSLDFIGRRVYWTDQRTGTISRANLDGSAREVLLTVEHIPFAIEVVSIPEPNSLALGIFCLAAAGGLRIFR